MGEPSGDSIQRRGPHSQQAFGWAWKRRFKRIVVFGLAGRAHGELGHGGLRPVVRDAARDGEARAAVGAVGEWVAITAVGGVEELTQAVRAGRGIGGDAGRDLPYYLTRDNQEIRFAFHSQVLSCNGIDSGQWRDLYTETGKESLNALSLAFDLDADPVRIVSDEACESLLRGEAVDEWPEADALHHTANQHSSPFWLWTGILNHGERLAPHTRIAYCGLAHRWHPMIDGRPGAGRFVPSKGLKSEFAYGRLADLARDDIMVGMKIGNGTLG